MFFKIIVFTVVFSSVFTQEPGLNEQPDLEPEIKPETTQEPLEDVQQEPVQADTPEVKPEIKEELTQEPTELITELGEPKEETQELKPDIAETKQEPVQADTPEVKPEIKEELTQETTELIPELGEPKEETQELKPDIVKTKQEPVQADTPKVKPKSKEELTQETTTTIVETKKESSELKEPEQKTLEIEPQVNKEDHHKSKQDDKPEIVQDPKKESKPKTDKELKKPHIVFICADDLGWDDVSFHGSDQILTPNIDTLAYQGIILQQYYTDTLGTPSRSALFTGKYPLRLGTQSESIKAAEDRGIPISERLLPAWLRELGYDTHFVGKWCVGKSREHYLPTYRGFDTFYGFLGCSVDYFTHNLIETFNHTSFFGKDLFENEKPVENVNGHLTDILTDRAVQVIRKHDTSKPLYLHVAHAAPHAGGARVSLQPPVDAIAANDHIAHSARRLYAALVTSLDKSVGHIVAALAEREILKDTLIVFVSDNGAPTTGDSQNFGCNLPLRGVKNTPWEGGARSIALMWNPSLNSGIWHGLVHVTDWLPTLVAAAGGNVNQTIDGINQWDALSKGEQPKRNELLVTIDDLRGWAAFREGDYKIIVGDLKADDENNGYQGLELKSLRREGPLYDQKLLECETFRVLKETLDISIDLDDAFSMRNKSNLLTNNIPPQDPVPCIPTRAKGCLYKISEDPLESQDVWQSSSEIVNRLSLRLRSLWSELKPRWQPQQDIRANPAKHNYTWIPWVENEEIVITPPTTIPPFPLQVSMGELKYLVNLNLNVFREKMFDSIKYMGTSFVKSIGGLFPF